MKIAEKDFSLKLLSIIKLLFSLCQASWKELSFRIALKWITRFHITGLLCLSLYLLFRYLKNLNFQSFGSFFSSTSTFCFSLSIISFLLKIPLSFKIYDSKLNIDDWFKLLIVLEGIFNPLGTILTKYALYSLPIKVWEKQKGDQAILSSALKPYLQKYSFPEPTSSNKLLLLTNLSFSYSSIPSALFKLYKRVMHSERVCALCSNFLSPSYLAERKMEEQTKLIKSLNLSFLSQKFIAIVGKNGSGKSTIAKIIVGLLSNYTGNVFWIGRELKEFSVKIFARHISYIPQHSIIYHDISLLEFISAGFAPSEGILSKRISKLEKEEKIKKILKELGMEREAHKSLASLSGGNKQKAIIARSIVQGTKIIVLDEPLNFLDIKSRILVLNYLKYLQKKHRISIIMIHHDIEQIKEYLDEIVIIDRGFLEAHIRL